MAKNLIPEIARMLGVELGEEFKVKGSGLVSDEIYKFSENALLYRRQGDDAYCLASSTTLHSLLAGDYEIVKLPWKPKKGERYWTFDTVVLGDALCIVRYTWDGDFNELTKLKVGWVYRTRAEAEAALPKVAKDAGVEYSI